MATAWIKQIMGSEKRTRHRWVSGHLDKGEKRKREDEIAQQITVFGEEMDRKGIAFRDDRDAWVTFWKRNPRAHMELVGASVDEVLGEKAFQVFKGFWGRRKKPIVVRFADDGMIASPPMLLTLGDGDTRVRANPLDALRSDNKEVRDRAVGQIDRAIQRCHTRIAGDTRRVDYLEKVRLGLQTGARAVETSPGTITVQGLLLPPDVTEEDMEDLIDDDDAE